jgi:hypothetical protein
MTNCKASSDKEGHAEFTCPACKTQVDRDIIVNVNNPESSHLRVKWDVVPNVAGCAGCKEGAKKFASMIKVEKMIKSAEAIKDQFPMANCVERVARKFGGNSTATFGPCKGQALAKCVCEQLQKLGLTKVNHLEKLASVYTQEDPMDKCIEDQMKKKYSKKESETLCACLKKKFASASDDNVFLQAFAQDKSFTEDDLNNINEVFNPDTQPTEDVVEEDIDISAPIEQEIEESKASADQEIVTIEVTKETAKELADAALQASEEVEVEVEVDEGIVEPGLEVSKVEESPIELEVEENIINPEEEKEMATAMQNHKILKVAEGVIKVAATPKVVKDIEGNVDAGVPRAKATMGKEGPDNIDKPMATPNVPRSNATMGKEGPDNINKPAGLPDVAVDSAYMGVEKEIQKGMPAINNEIKGTVIATNKQAKELKEVETVEKDVDAGVPRAKATMGKEGPDNIDKPMAKPSVPRANAEMGNESSENINPKVTGPDVPIDSAYMGSEKEVQKDMPAINNEILKNVQQKKDVQLERIANARKIKAIEVTAKLLATSRVTEEAYEDVIEALSRFEIDKIASVADKMYPRQSKKASLEVANKDVHSIPSIVMESKEVTSSTNDFMQKLASHFTIGSKSFDESLSKDGDK